MFLEMVGADVTLDPHGIRVLWYNKSLEGNGGDITVMHGDGLAKATSAMRVYLWFVSLASLQI